MQYNEWYEIHWKRRKGPDEVISTSSVRHFDDLDVANEEYMHMVFDPNVTMVTMSRHSTVQLNYHSKA